ncbi:MAG: penicillin acylase family protein [Polyangiales bacterium]
MNTKTLVALSAMAMLLACGDDDSPTDAGPSGDAADVGSDASVDGSVDGEVGDAGPVPLPPLGLAGDARAVQDTRGMWHIYGESEEDVYRVEGYLQARDRFGQMIFLRRAVRGELTEIIPAAFSPALIGQDTAARFLGYRRHAEATWAAMQENDPDNAAIFVAFSAGVNAYIEQIEAGVATLPRGIADVFGVVGLTTYKRWEPVDSLAIAKFLAASLSIEVRRDLERSLSREAWAETFPSDSTDPRRAALSDAYLDVFSFEAAEKAYTADGFPSVPESIALRDAPAPRTHVDVDSLRAALPIADAIESHFATWFGDGSRGSNSWAIAADRSAGGHPVLANDPHLALPSPPLHWQAQLNTKNAGGQLNVAGLVFAGTPLVLFGYNDDIAWGLTVGRLDVTDTYAETLEDDAVVFDPDPSDGTPAERRALVRITETLTQTDGSEMDVTFELVPIGPAADPMAATRIIIPESRTETSAISVRWTGMGSTSELTTIADMSRATSVNEAVDALEFFTVGGVNWTIIDEENIYWRDQAFVPVRDPRALTFDAETGEGDAPCFVLPGTGEYEWLREANEALGANDRGFLESSLLPQLRNPASGFIATANADPVGVTDDGNPFDSDYYIGWRFESHRMARIDERLTELVARGDVTLEESMELQGDKRSPIGAMTRDAIVAELTRALEEAESAGTHSDLQTLVADLDAGAVAALTSARDRLEAWSFEAESGLDADGTLTSNVQANADSIATTIFNVAMTRIHSGLIDDEIAALNPGVDCATEACTPPGDAFYTLALSEPTRLRSYDAELGDTPMWDDLSTEVVETRGVIVVRSVVAALAYLAERLESEDMETWQWGRLHTIRFATVVPQLGEDLLSIPTVENEIVPGGFPRGGDRESVDVANFGSRSLEDFSYNNGAIQRLVVEMGPDGPRVFNALPGGNAYDPDSPHQADEVEFWRRNEAPQVFHTNEDVMANMERELNFVAE